ncbi:MAG TPA: class I SAM-dependent methyltransferase [Chloroflexota bacterium]|nr:class I SAM-dependent methyltransferase [Chloroflexota bacterium]
MTTSPDRPKPGPLGEEFGRQFSDPSVVAAYHLRPPYPPATFDILLELLGDRPSNVLDAGCGTGDVARPLARLVQRVDAVDRSEAMLARGRHLPGGDAAGLNWVHGRLEDAPLRPPYGLVTCAESLHWMDWRVVLPRFAAALVAGGYVAIVVRHQRRTPWADAAWQVGGRYSTNEASGSYDLVRELEERDLFARVGSRETATVDVRQSLDDFVESYHSRNGLSRDRLTPAAAAAFDAEMRAAVAPFCSDDDTVELHISASVTWGLPKS